MSVLVVTSFDSHDEAQQVFQILEHLRRDSQPGLQVSMITKNADGTAASAHLGDGTTTLPIPHEADIPEENHQLLAHVLSAMTPDTSSLLLMVADQESSAMILTLLLLFLPNKQARGQRPNIVLSSHQEEYLTQVLETYQTTVSNLDHLDSTSTEAEVDHAFSAVESAYAVLMSSFRDVIGMNDQDK